MNLELKNDVSVEEYCMLRKKMNYPPRKENIIKNAISSSMYIKKAVLDNEPVGLARVIGDGIYAFIVDVGVIPEHQGKGIGQAMIEGVLKDIEDNMEIGETILVNLISVKGKEGFYEKCGFNKIPYENTGYGMKKIIEK